jgi:hypothetical protein
MKEAACRTDLGPLTKKLLYQQQVIERLTAERDEARRELCRWSSFYYEEHIDINEGPPRARDREEAARRGWDCFRKKAP